MTADDPAVPIVCQECDTETEVPLSEVGEMLDRHNENQHGGQQCAQVDPALADQLQNLVAEDMGLLD
jgi:hypothetical protein